LCYKIRKLRQPFDQRRNTWQGIKMKGLAGED
jgi:hypothetical protein